MTVYNASLYVEASIRSILQQTFPDFALIIIDDGSTDGSRIILESIHDARIKSYYHEHHGRAHALNEGLKHVHTPFVAFMDADDLAMPERLALQVTLLDEHPEIGAVSTWYQMIDPTGEKRGTIYQLPVQHVNIESEMTKHCSLCFPALMVRKEALERTGLFNEQLQSAIDYEWFLRLISATQVANIPQTLLLHRRHKHSISSNLLEDQQANKYYFAKEYLLQKLQDVVYPVEQCTIYLRLGINEYYYGSMKRARMWFTKSMPKGVRYKDFWRYAIPAILGDTIFKHYRKFWTKF
jgi:glycosyltransferase involved in cell wall biosynthesis